MNWKKSFTKQVRKWAIQLLVNMPQADFDVFLENLLQSRRLRANTPMEALSKRRPLPPRGRKIMLFNYDTISGVTTNGGSFDC